MWEKEYSSPQKERVGIIYMGEREKECSSPHSDIQPKDLTDIQPKDLTDIQPKDLSDIQPKDLTDIQPKDLG